MQQTFQLNTDHLNTNFIKSVRAMFNHRTVRITIEDVEPAVVQEEEKEGQRQIFLKSQELQNMYPPIHVSQDIDLSALANDVNL